MEQTDGLILKGVGGRYTVRCADGTLLECGARGIFRKDGVSPLVGDRVRLQYDPSPVIAEIAPRKNSLTRPRIANVDLMVIVSSMVEPSLNRFLLDKMTAVAVNKSMEPVIVLTKTDLRPDDGAAAVYRKIGMKCLTLSPNDDSGLNELRAWMKGRISVFTGNSGVGKSTLLGRLMNRTLETGDISRKLGRGRHTTREVTLYELPGGGYTADTPGFSTLDIERYDCVRRDELVLCFPEFAPFRTECRFADCTHRTEPGCAVLDAVRSGRIPVSRHESYCRMFEEVQTLQHWERPADAAKRVSRPR